MGFWKNLTSRFSPEQKANPAGQFIVAQVGGEAVWTPRDYKHLSETGYGANAYVFASVNERAAAVGGIPWKLCSVAKGGEKTDILEHPLLTLMNRPNPDQGGSEFWAEVSAYYSLSANSYTISVGPNAGPPIELWNLRPDRTKVLKGTALEPISGYEYGGIGGPRFGNKEVMHLKSFHPTHDWYGMSPLEAGARSIDANNLAKAWNVSVLQNKGQPSGAMVFKTKLNPEQKRSVHEQISDQVSGRGLKGWANAGNVLVLEGMAGDGFEWTPFSQTAQEMDWLEGQRLSAKEIAIAFNIPPELIGDTDSKTYSNYREARKAFYMENVLPFMDRLTSALNNWLTPLFGDNLRLEYDKSDIEAIQRDRTEQTEQAVMLFQSGLVNKGEARVIAGLPDDVDDADLMVLPANLIPVFGKEALELEAPKPVEAAPKDPEDPKDPEVDPEDPEEDEKKSIATDPAAKAAFLKAVDRQRSRFDLSAARTMLEAFRKERRLVLKALEGATDSTVLTAVESALNESAGIWATQLKTLYIQVGAPFAAQVNEQLGIKGATTTALVVFTGLAVETKGPADLWLEEAIAYLETHGLLRIKSAFITEATRKLLTKTITEGLAAGEGIPEISKRITAEYAEFAGQRATRIARTEVIAASNLGADAAATATGLPLKKTWLAAADAAVRDDHAAADGSTVKKDEPFIVGGEELMFPGDTSRGASAGNVINCRCTPVYSIDRD